MPLLFVLLVTLLIYGFQSGGFDQAFDFMFDFKFDVISTETWLIALGRLFYFEFRNGRDDGLWFLRSK